MDQETAVNKVFRILKSRNMIFPRSENQVKEYLTQLYAIGHNEGLSYNTKKVPVAKCNDFGEIISPYKSVQEAATKNNIDHRNISRAATRNIRAGGFHWKYI